MKPGPKIILLVCMTTLCQGQVVQVDTTQKRQCIVQDLNYIQYFDKSVWQSFSEKWSGKGRMRIALFGDSHVQPDIYPGEMRRQLQAVRGEGGFGMAFPFSAAKTYSTIDYFSSHTDH